MVESAKMEKKTRVTRPWEPAPLLTVKGEDPNYTYRWVDVGKLEKKLLEEWEVVQGVSKSGERGGSITLSDGTQIDSCIRKRELILCRMRKDRAEAREKYYRELRRKSMKRPKEELAESIGNSMIGDMTIRR